MKLNERPRVLIVEDDGDVMEIIRHMLARDFVVETATNGKEAVEKYLQWKPNVVLMDLLMPLLDGIEATKMILKFDPGAKIIAVTAYASKKEKEILEAGAVEVISKPFTMERLIGTVKKYAMNHAQKTAKTSSCGHLPSSSLRKRFDNKGTIFFS